VRRFVFSLLLTVTSVAEAQTVTLLHFSDYHSHAQPFYSEGREEQGGIARAVGYLRRQKQRGALVFSGGDMMNKGAPAWSDRFGCAEWPWLNGIVDAMAFGNHDADYGHQAFVQCRDGVTYPILSANTNGFQPYVVLKSRGLRIGVFAVAGSDFTQLVKVPELQFSDRVAAARTVVATLRDREKVNAIVLIGHQSTEDDFALARAVPGIDLIFGTHSHFKQGLTRIDETSTWFISPSQYLTYISRVEMRFQRGALADVDGTLVRVDRSLPVDRRVRDRVRAMQRTLERDKAYAALFVPFATLREPMSVEAVAQLSVETMRDVAGADAALSTASSFRAALPPGKLDMETLRAALPYDNEIVVAELPRETYAQLVTFARSRPGTDAFSWIAESSTSRGGTVRVAATDYLATIAPGYRDFFKGADLKKTGKRVREEVQRALTTLIQ
jgi:5'-nucleotidase / UDP-sugar diphosphatase